MPHNSWLWVSIQSKFEKLILFTHKCPFFSPMFIFLHISAIDFSDHHRMTIRRCLSYVLPKLPPANGTIVWAICQTLWWSVASQEVKTIKMCMKLLKLLSVYKTFSCLHLCQWHLKYFERRKWRLGNHQSRPLIEISLRSCKAIIYLNVRYSSQQYHEF